MKKPNGTSRFLKKLAIFLLAFFLGIIVAFGSIVGVLYYGVSGLTLNKLKGLTGINVGDQYFDASGTVDVRDLSVLKMIEEFNRLSTKASDTTIEGMIKYYGLILSEETKASIPEGVMKMTFEELAADPVSAVLNNVTMGNVLSLSGMPLFGERGGEVVKDRPITLLLEGDYSQLLEGLYLGDALEDVTIELDAAGNPKAIFDPSAEVTAIQKAIALLDLGKLGKGIEEGNLQAPLIEALGTVPLNELMESGEDSFITDAIEDKTLGDVLHADETGGMVFDINGVMNDLYLGSFLGYDPKYDEDGTLLYFYKMDGTVEAPATGIYKALAPIKVGELSSGDVELMEELDAVYLGEILEYTQGALTEDATDDQPAKYAWSHKADGSEPVTGIDLTLANLTIGTLTSGHIDMEVLGINELPLYEVLGYEQRADGNWYPSSDPGAVPASSALAAMMQLEVGNIGTEMESLYVGELMGFDKVLLRLSDGKYIPYDEAVLTEHPTEYELAFMKKNEAGEYDPDDLDDPSEVPTGVVKTFVTMKISELSDDSAINESVQNLQIGDAMGYTYDEDTGKWLDASKNPASGIIAALAGTTVSGLDSRIDALYIGEVIGFDKVLLRLSDGEYIPYDEALLTEHPAEYELAFVKKNAAGEYDPDDLADPSEVPTGIMAAFAGMTMSDMEDSAKISAAVQDVKVGDAMGYSYNEDDGKWYKDDAYTTPVEGLFGTLANEPVKSLDSAVKKVKVGDAMGYYYDETEGLWYTDSTKATRVDGLFAALAGQEVQNMSAEVDKIYLGQVMGYEPVMWDAAEGKYVPFENPENDPAKKPLFLRMKKDAGGNYDYDTADQPSGVMASFSGMTMQDVKNSEKMSETIKTIKVGDAMGYSYNENNGKWYTDSTYTTEVTDKIVLAVVDGQVGDMGTTIQNLEISDVFDMQSPSGFLKLLDPTTKLTELPDTASALFDKDSGVTIGELIGAGLLDMSASESTLDGIFGDDVWKGYTIQEFVDELIAKIDHYKNMLEQAGIPLS